MRLRALLWALLFALMALGAAAPGIAQQRPNIVLFLADDLGWADWEQNGGPFGSSYYETPNMNRLAQEGVTFTNAYASAATCSPTRDALMTGQTPARSHLTSWLPGSEAPSNLSDPLWSPGIDSGAVTLPELLRAAGYRTALVGKWHLGISGSPSADPLQHGFEVNFGGGWNGTPPTYFANASGSFRLTNMGDGTAAPGTYLTDQLTDLALDQIDAFAADGGPFFLFLSHYAPHIPLAAPAALVDRYAAKPPSGGQDDPVYAAMIDSLDTSLGRVLDELERLGLRENTIFIFASDNGGSPLATSNFPLSGFKGRLYEGGVRVPLIVSYTGDPALVPGSERESLVVSHDLYPTLLDLAGVSGDPIHDATVDGHSIRTILEQGDAPSDPIFWHHPHISPYPLGGHGGRYVSAIRDGDWKAIFFYEDRSWELYDLVSDPGEKVDLSSAEPAVLEDLGSELVARLETTGAQMPLDASTGLPAPLPVPAPEPGATLEVEAALVVLAGLARRRGHARTRRSPASRPA